VIDAIIGHIDGKAIANARLFHPIRAVLRRPILASWRGSLETYHLERQRFRYAWGIVFMHTRAGLHGLSIAAAALILSACAASEPPIQEAAATQQPTATEEPATPEPTATPLPEWFHIELTDVTTGEVFTISDFAGQVVLLEAMAQWCPNCLFQQGEIRKLHESLGYPDDLVSISLDVDSNEDAESLKAYVEEFGYDWRFAVSTRQVNHDLGNLYSAQYLNPPLSPMMIIDRDGSIEHLPYGFKEVDTLLSFVEPYLE
jgi:thiol-disulfide isomerase/thioredoxin